MLDAIKVTVTAAHIADAKPYPNSSPIALALRDLGFGDACVTKSYAYCGDKVYTIPEQAIALERCFNHLVGIGATKEKIAENINPSTFELVELVQ
jgi:hypothetical protein